MPMDSQYQGSCFCGEIQFTVTGNPVGMGYCHCDSCRKWSAGPLNAFTLWKPESLRLSKGEQSLASFNKTPQSSRKWCTKCGGHLFTDHPAMGLVDVFAAVIDDFPFEPGVHVHYQERALRIHDGITKLKDVPREMGGSGTELPE